MEKFKKTFISHELFEHDNSWTIIIEAPGYSENDIKAVMEGCYLKINGDSNYGSFEKTFIIAQNHIEKIEINVKNGIVNIKLFKNEQFKIPIVFK